jgi:ESS family glutamate:Na+ symporter
MYTFGWSTGVTAIGITLLRIVDPEFKTKTLDDFAIAYIPMSFVEMSVVALAPIAIATGFAWHYTGVICAATLGVILIAWRMRWFYRHGALRTGDSGRTLAE